MYYLIQHYKTSRLEMSDGPICVQIDQLVAGLIFLWAVRVSPLRIAVYIYMSRLTRLAKWVRF